MASMMGGDFVEAYVLKNAYKEKLRRMDQAEAAAALHGAKSSKDKEDAGATGEKKAAGGGGASSRGGFFGLMKKKVHPKPKASAATSS
ncbi:hypothetical protein CFC21_086628 [Triticum aestivum]|uniref:Uncharacterized protein n=2 Tax=Triticum aestivum TaxID=4565 RepID=A0A3B6PGH4_WHEAT|nr:uncharacterized protein LOC119325407 [Triticum dicoccoides]XP_044408924.1 uncharacterized protein LOC123133508 [Triticum aestivum]KAF7082778.1 hypothetical protein CFC21_086628 [Triticum aestivum]